MEALDPRVSLKGADNIPTLLLVDDEPNILSALRRLTRHEPWRVATAESGEAGLQVLAQEPVNVIISDMRMPGMSGAEFLSKARQDYPDATRILLTGYADIQSTIQAINDGAIYRYINKPWDDVEVLNILRDVMARQQLQLKAARLEALTHAQNAELKQLNAELESRVQARTAELRQTVSFLEQAQDKLKKNYLTTIKVFTNLIELREGPRAGHARRVADLSRRLAKHMGMSDHDVNDVFLAALLHDIGKIGVPDAIINKPFTELGPEERTVYIRHAANGQAALMALEHLAGVGVLIRSHHERFDGLGYPDNLAGDSIPLGARIIAAANDYDGLQGTTLQATPLPPEDAHKMLQRGAGKRYDPEVIAALDAVLITKPAEPVVEEIVVRAGGLVAGMQLSRDLISLDGVLLLSRDHELDDRVITQLRQFEEADGHPLSIHVLARK